MFRYLAMLIWPLMGAGFMVNLIQRGAVSLGRVNEILNTVPSIRDTDPNILTQRRRGAEEEGEIHSFSASRTKGTTRLRVRSSEDKYTNDIEIKDLSFAYNDGEAVLENINLTVNRGEWLGIMGKTGSGKSTLIKTLTRTVDPPPGTVSVFGVDVHDMHLSDLRVLFSVSPQDSYLFSDSIQNNIGYGVDSPDTQLVQKAAQMSALERDIAAFADGKDTLIGERGLTLSGGQKQRVAVARSLVTDSEFLILDDSLSAVDAETERKILDSLLAVRKGRTTIIISHRVSTLCHTDKVLVLDGGRQAEYGSPAELAKAGGFYSRMAALQRLDEVTHG
jgi:ATP-binding cassette subfamily B protein